MAVALREMMDESPEFLAILLELHTLGRTNPEVAAELRELHRRVRVHLGGILAEARDAGVVTLAAEPEVVAEVLFSLADGARHADAGRAGARLRADARRRAAAPPPRSSADPASPGPGSGDGEGSPR